MSSINLLAVGTAAVAVFFIGFLWYMPFAFGSFWAALRGIDPSALTETAPSAPVILFELVRCLLMVSALAILISLVQPSGIAGTLGLALLVWFGFQAVLLSGSVLHENYPVGLWLIHAGDALAKAIVAATILSLWR